MPLYIVFITLNIPLYPFCGWYGHLFCLILTDDFYIICADPFSYLNQERGTWTGWRVLNSVDTQNVQEGGSPLLLLHQICPDDPHCFLNTLGGHHFYSHPHSCPSSLSPHPVRVFMLVAIDAELQREDSCGRSIGHHPLLSYYDNHRFFAKLPLLHNHPPMICHRDIFLVNANGWIRCISKVYQR